MDDQALLMEIKDLYDKLKSNINGTYRGGTKIGEPGFGYELDAKELLNKVEELYTNFHPDYLDITNIVDLKNTIDNEVSHVDKLYLETLNQRAPKKKRVELDNAIERANKQIKSDLFRLFEKIRK